MLKVALIAALLPCAFLSVGFPQNCTLSGTPAWSKQLGHVIGNCDNRFTSPSGRLLLHINAEGQIQISEVASASKAPIHSGVVSPPAMISWSPRSDAFFVDDGEGSGMSSTFRLFRVKDSQVAEDGTIEARAVAIYRNQKRCSSDAADPNVWGIGWSPDGTRVYLLIQATVNMPCGEPGSFIGLTIKAADGSVLQQFSEEATKRRFRPLLPPEVYSK